MKYLKDLLLRIPHQRRVFKKLTLLSKVVKVVFPPKFAIMGALARKRVTTQFIFHKSPSDREHIFKQHFFCAFGLDYDSKPNVLQCVSLGIVC